MSDEPKPKVFMRPFFSCPSCGEGAHSCDHLETGRNWGPWYCDLCGAGFRGSVKDGTPIDVAIVDGERSQHTLSLLRLRSDLADGTTVFLVVKGIGFGETVDENEEYYFNEHTCPTNFLRNVDTIIAGDDTDPHGIFEWVETIERPENFDGSVTHEEACKLFPVLLTLGAKIIEGSASEAQAPKPVLLPPLGQTQKEPRQPVEASGAKSMDLAEARTSLISPDLPLE